MYLPNLRKNILQILRMNPQKLTPLSLFSSTDLIEFFDLQNPSTAYSWNQIRSHRGVA